jgi:hypothetical protein
MDLNRGGSKIERHDARKMPQNKKYLCAIGSLSAGSQTRSSPSAVTS